MCKGLLPQAFSTCAYCMRSFIFKVVTLVGSNQHNYFENTTACSNRTPKTRVATRLRRINDFFTEPPAPPLGLQVLEVTSQSVRLSWQIQTAAQPGFNDDADAPRISKFIVELAEMQGKKSINLFR